MITLINPPNPPNAVSNKDTMGGLGQLYGLGAQHSLPPLDMPAAAAVIRQRKIPVRVIECLGLHWGVSELVLHLASEKPKLVAIRTSTPTFEWVLQVAQIVKVVTQATVVLFGPHVALFPERSLQSPFVDAIIVGEAEVALAEVVERGIEGVDGVWNKIGGKIVSRGTREPLSDLDLLPFAAWDLMPYQAYDGGERMQNVKPFVTLLSSKGCPHGCSYCPYPVIQGRKLRVRSACSVVSEIEWLVQSLGVKAVLFRDPEFALQRERVVAICDGIIAKKLKLVWRCETRMEDLDAELIQLMARAGCIGVNMGVESADEEVLRNVNRRFISFEKRKRVVDACHQNGIETFCFYVLGLPGETRDSALRTIDYSLRLQSKYTQFTVATPYFGTDLRKKAEKEGFISDDPLNGLTSYSVAMRNAAMSVEEIKWLQWLANESFEMKWPALTKRLLSGFSSSAFEAKRFARFCYARLKCRLG